MSGKENTAGIALIMSALEQTEEGIGIIDPSGILIYANRAFAEMHGYTVQELDGVHVSRFHRPEDMPAVDEANRQVVSSGSFSGEITHLRKDGSIFPALMQSSYLTGDHGEPLGIVGTLQDISDLKSGMEELEETRSLLTSVLDAIPDIIGIQDRHHGVLRYNEAGYRYLGITPDQMVGKKCYELIGRTVPCEKCATSLTYKSREPEHIEKFVEGMERWLDVRAYPILNDKGELVKVIEHLRDITDRKRTEIRNRKLEQQVRTTQKLESLGVLAGGIAHDFNNILMAILGNADLAMQDQDLSEETSGYLAEIISASRRASDLTGQMLDYSGRTEPKRKQVDVNRIISDTAMMLSVSVSRKTSLEYDLEEGLPLVYADPVQLQQVLMNLMTNASEALENRPGTVKLSTYLKFCRSGELSETFVNDELPQGNYVVIKVSDTGSGMDRRTLSRIFDPFFSTKFTGRGLGLAAVLGVVRAHKGAVKVDSRIRKGSVFTIFLPASGEPGEEQIAVEEPRPSSGKGLVLLVDDEESVRLVTGKMLSRLGYTVEYACDGMEALAKYSMSPEGFVCVIMDLTMPVMDGVETSRRMLDLDPDARIIVSSGFTEEAIMKEYSGMNIAGMLQKPYSLSDISHVVKKVLLQ